MRVALVVAAVACAAGTAFAGSRVVVRAMPDQPVPAELVDTLRIFLASSATVEIGAPLAAATLDARIDEASAGLEAGTLVTWLERPPAADGAYTVVVVGERDGRAAVEVGKLDGPDTAAVSRLLALRIGAFLDETLTAGPASPLATSVERASPPPPPPRARRLGAIVEVGAGAMVGDGIDGIGEVAVGARFSRGTYALEAVAIGRLGWPSTHEGDGGDQVELSVADAAAGARFVVTRRRVWLGAALDIAARRVRADGMAADGARGGAVRWLPVARVGGDARVVLGAVALRGLVGIERGLGGERFTVRGDEVAVVGRLAFVATLGVTIPLDL